MLLSLLKTRFAIHFAGREVARLNANNHSTNFALHDSKSCAQCPNKDCQNDSPYTVLNVGVQESSVMEIDYDAFISELFLQHEKPKNCDFILSSQNSIVLCELTCSHEKALTPLAKSGGKRAQAMCQLSVTKKMLYKVPEIAQYINDNCTRKVLLFGYRLKSKILESDQAKYTNPFLSAPGASDAIIISLGDDGFVFEQREFPKSFNM